jgi:succinate dehydrogenase / fumarate reductase cytochrome b subunit
VITTRRASRIERNIVATTAPGVLERNHFLLRRLHSLTGIIPIGAFLFNHLLTNSTAFLGAEHFDEHVLWIHSLPWLLFIEIFFIFLPLAFHGGYGVLIALQGRPNQSQYPYMDNWRYTLQRVTAWIALVFILLHLSHFRFAHWFGGPAYAPAVHEPGSFEITRQGFMQLWLPMWLWVTIYVVGTAATVFHFCNGIATFCITWGITVGDASRKRVSVAAAGLGVVLMAWGVASLYALTRAQQEAEQRHRGQAPPAHVQGAMAAVE